MYELFLIFDLIYLFISIRIVIAVCKPTFVAMAFCKPSFVAMAVL